MCLILGHATQYTLAAVSLLSPYSQNDLSLALFFTHYESVCVLATCTLA